MRLIDKDKLIDEIEKRAEGRGDFKPLYIPTVCDIEDIINYAPTVNQWHYPSKGELPTENGKYLVDWRGEYGEHIDIDQWSDGKWLYMGEVVAWQHIVPPKEEA